MFGDSFFTPVKLGEHDGAFMFVFVPMFGDSFFTALIEIASIPFIVVFVPMFGDSFFTRRGETP